jgi:hypothetical protein
MDRSWRQAHCHDRPTPKTNASYGFTIVGNVITIVSGGAVTFVGGATGL